MTSGASETILRNFLSRSSRATGPKTRVADGLVRLVDDDRSILIKTDVGAVLAAVLFCGCGR